MTSGDRVKHMDELHTITPPQADLQIPHYEPEADLEFPNIEECTRAVAGSWLYSYPHIHHDTGKIYAVCTLDSECRVTGHDHPDVAP